MAFRRRAAKPAADPVAGVVDPATVPPAYRAAVEDALRARSQFHALLTTTVPGPMQDRLQEVAAKVDAGVLAVWQAVQQATKLEQVVTTLDPQRVTEDLKRARRAEQTGQADAEAVETLSARFASTQRLLNALEELRQRIPLLEARLGTAVARAAELTLTSSASPSAAGLEGLGGELDQLVLELEALQAGAAAVS
jgi:hypothetical protein